MEIKLAEEKITNVPTEEYDENQIQVLEGLEAVRKRPGMYIGTTSVRGLHHLVYEIVDNSIDEAMAGRCDTIDVTINEDGSITVTDNGHGVPSLIHPKMGIPTLEVVFSVLHAGGKFGGGGYKISGGLHGVGASVVNALSEWMEIDNFYEGKEYTLRFERGVKTRDFKCEGDANGKHGLSVTFMPDSEIFETTVFDYDILLGRLREQSFLNAGIRIHLKDNRESAVVENEDGESVQREDDLSFEGGIRSFVDYLNEQRGVDTIHPQVIYMIAKKGDITAEVAMQYNDSYNEVIYTFANNMATIDGGTHDVGFKTALTRVINDYARKTGALKDKDKNLTGDDAREGLCAVVSVKLPDAQFESQTKAKLGNSEVRSIVDSIVSEKLAEFFEENPSVGKAVIEKALAASRARIAARNARESSRKSVLESTSLPGKLADCSDKRMEFSEVFLVEGDSAGGSAKSGRDSRFQAILPLRGKVLNVEKSRIDKVFANPSLTPIIQALGCGIGEYFDINKLRYGKIIIMADADVDGAHIQILLLTFFFRHMRPLIDAGHIYLAKPPLYRIHKGKQEMHAFSDEERDRCLEILGEKAVVERYKGLGEMDADELKRTTMDPATRTIMKVTVEDAMKCDEIITLLMGDKVEPRKHFIEQNARYVENIDV